eukprot:TRINITY_DN3363_c0_g1_i1.p1 TRINITY_DN3363_c0_g1~~TRINITY_DN3363_c0_g1_i1.p1  ORF type:complete len:666 (+),score=319.37 TRINITY_DN3363_c0_g1_i1:65-2062(+)
MAAMRSTAAALLLAAPLAGASSISPVGKVIQMLADMKMNGMKAVEAEAQVMTDYSKFVRRRKLDLDHEIETGTANAEKLTATIVKAESDVERLGDKLTELDGQIATLESDITSAIAMRKDETAKYEATEKDYTESLYALEQAISTLQAQHFDRPQALVQLQQLAKDSHGMQRVIAELSLLQEGSDGAPAVAGYETQTGGVIEMLVQLQDKFRKELGDLQKENMNAEHAHSMQLVDMQDTQTSLKTDRQDTVVAKATAAKTAAESKAELATVEAALADAKKALEDMQATYATKKATFETNQKVRSGELEAITKAIEILSSEEVSGAYADHVKVLLQKPQGQDDSKKGPASFLQLRGTSRRVDANRRALEFLKERATSLSSKTLANLAAQMGDSPFAKVIGMIETLLERLQEEAASEAEHKAYCDEELKKNKLKRNELNSDASRLRAEADAKFAAVKKMEGDIEQLAKEQAELQTAMKEATEVRQKEKAENEVAIKDSKHGLEAVRAAVAVLKEFYAKQGGEFLQAKKQVPEMESYGGMSGKNQGVLSMLEVIESDFARVVSDTEAAESVAAADHKTFMEDSEADHKAKHDREFKLSLEKDQTDFEREQAEKDLAATLEQLDKANAYFGELKPQCIQVHVSFEERQAMRQEEIEALQRAYQILDQKQ